MICFSGVVLNCGCDLMTNFASLGLILACAFGMLTTSGCFLKKQSGSGQVVAEKKSRGKSALVFSSHQPPTLTTLIKEMEKEVKKNPADVSLKYELAKMYQEAGYYQEAAETFKLCYVFSIRNVKTDKNDLIKYQEYSTLAEIAKFKELQCRAKIILQAHDECDPLPLESLVKNCDVFMKEMPSSQYIDEVSCIKTQCRDRLFNKLILVFYSHLHSGNFVAAKTKLNKIKNDFSTDVNPELKPRIMYCEYKLLAKCGASEAGDHFAALKQEFPDSVYVKMAEGIESKRTGLFLA